MSASLQFSIQDASNMPEVKIISFSGDADESNQDTLSEPFKTLLARSDVKFVVVNLKHLEYVNSSSIGLIANLHSRFQDEGKDFVFAQANDHIFDIIDLVGLTTVITLYQTIEEACVSFEK